mgnify:CR=1 FL=1
MIIGQRVPEISVRTNRQTTYFSNIDVGVKKWKEHSIHSLRSNFPTLVFGHLHIFRSDFNFKVATCNHDFIWFEKGIPNPQMSLAANDVSFSYQDLFYGFLCDLCVWSLDTSIYFWRKKLKWVIYGNFQTIRLVLITSETKKNQSMYLEWIHLPIKMENTFPLEDEFILNQCTNPKKIAF